ncbi:MAG: DUF2757 family protein [Thermaerobacter sp.]|nr:DUF2757 family protein [Thermaerobacter sp.]
MVDYVCGQCGRRIAQYEGRWDDPRLGLTDLRPEQLEDIVTHSAQDFTLVRVRCEACLPMPWGEPLWYN